MLLSQPLLTSLSRLFCGHKVILEKYIIEIHIFGVYVSFHQFWYYINRLRKTYVHDFHYCQHTLSWWQRLLCIWFPSVSCSSLCTRSQQSEPCSQCHYHWNPALTQLTKPLQRWNLGVVVDRWVRVCTQHSVILGSRVSLSLGCQLRGSCSLGDLGEPGK